MARDRLTALQVKRAHEKGAPVLLPDGAGLCLREQSASGTTWTLRYRFGGRDRWMALGRYPDMELADARKATRQTHCRRGDRFVKVTNCKLRGRRRPASQVEEISDDFQ